MQVARDPEMFKEYVAAALGATPDRPILIDMFLEDAIADGTDAFVPAVI